MAKSRTDTEAVVKLVINGQQAKTTAKELSDAYRRFSNELINMKKADDPRGYAEKAKQVKVLKSALDEARKEAAGLSNESKKLSVNWKDIAAGVAGGFGVGAAIGLMKNFGQQVFDTTAKFQKLEAVLTTTLGSNSQAKLIMGQIQEFASKTPFQVDELTDSYVRLANQGFKPTMEQLRSLGDLSASTGKDFTQLTEAIIDAQTGEFERLKEFGIRASKEGDKVSFTFKGVATQVDFTADSIRDYITELGNVEGITGSMAAISETLSGQVSNLGDSWESLLKTVGEETEGVFSTAISLMSNAISSLQQYIQNLNIAQKYDAPGTSFKERLAEMQALASGSVNVAAIQRSAFADVSAAIDANIGKAKYFSELQTVLDDVQGRMKIVDRSTREGAAAYALYADKVKMVVDAAKGLKNDRQQKLLQDQAKAGKEAAEASEKARKEREKLAKATEKALEKEYDGLRKLAGEMERDFKIKSLEGLDQKLAEIDKRYGPLIEKAKKFKDAALVGVFMRLMGGEKLNAEKDQWDKDQDTASKIRQEKFNEDKERLEAEYARKEVDNINNAGSQEELDEMNYRLEEEKLIALKLLYEAYGEDAVEFERSLADRKLAERQRLNDGRKELSDSEIATEQAVWEAMETGVSMLKGIVDSTSGMYKALLVVEKAMAIARIVINTQAEISGYYAKYSLVPGGLAIATGLAANAKIRAGLSIGMVAAAGIAEAIGSGNKKSEKKYAKGGFIARGASHSQGGIKLVDAITGAVVGEVEGDEPILSKETYRNNKETIDALLYSSQRKSGANISLDSGRISTGERVYRNGGTLDRPSLSSRMVSDPVVNNITTTVDLTRLEEKMDMFVDAANNAWNYRLLEKKRAEYDRISDDLNS